jgi:hypothetical protein
MKNLFTINEEEKNRVLEMHSGKKTIISEQPKLNAYGEKIPKHPTDSKLWTNMINDIEGDGVSITKETPNQLMIQGVTGDWIITFKR